MNYYYEASKTFQQKLQELDLLIKLIKQNENNSSLYSSLIKSNIVLMTSYFEVYIEELIEEFITKLNNKELESRYIPENIKKFQAKYIKEKIKIKNPVKNKNENYEDFLQQKTLEYLINNWNNQKVKLDILESEIEYFNNKTNKTEVIQIQPINKFSYGSHGTKEIQKLFKNIGLSIFDEIDEKNRNLFNELVGKRNNIIHDGGKTLSTSYRDTKIYLIFLKKSIKKIDNIIKEYLLQIVNNAH